MDIVTAKQKSVRTGLTSWQQEVKTAIRDTCELLELLDLEPAGFAESLDETTAFPIFVPRSFLHRMRPGDPRDPLLLQVLPLSQERDRTPGFSSDAVGDLNSTVQSGLIQKYHGRALVIAAGTCSVNCRFCFRREFPYDQRPVRAEQWENIWREIEAAPKLEEVILSGGDPLMLADHKLASIVKRVESIPHVHTLRIHTRLPIMIPARVTHSLVELLAHSRLRPVVVVHANHPEEIDNAVAEGLMRLRDAGILLLNQTVLLRDINDCAQSLIALSKRLIGAGCLPYYLHQLDRVSGTAHFEVPLETGKQIIEEMRASLPGYAVPRYVRETPGQLSKTVIA